MNIFHKTEVQLVILRYWIGLKLYWFKSYDTNSKKCKNAKNAKDEKTEREIFAFCVIMFESIKI